MLQETSGQSYKHFMLIYYDSRVVIYERKMFYRIDHKIGMYGSPRPIKDTVMHLDDCILTGHNDVQFYPST